MKHLLLLLLLPLLSSCINNTNGGGSTCSFVADTLRRDSTSFATLESQLDNSRSYVFQTQDVKMDSLLPALCRANFNIDSAYLVTGYLCMDAIGPRPIVVLESPDDRMLSTGFHQHGTGLSGRFACASSIARFTLIGLP